MTQAELNAGNLLLTDITAVNGVLSNMPDIGETIPTMDDLVNVLKTISPMMTFQAKLPSTVPMAVVTYYNTVRDSLTAFKNSLETQLEAL